MKNFLRAKFMWCYISGIKTKSIDTKFNNYATALEVWEVDNSKIIIWVNNSVIYSIGAQLAKYDITKEVSDHLSQLYTQSSFA